MSIERHDIAAYQGSKIKVYVFEPSDNTMHQVRGAQNFGTTEERTESRVGELGFDATKVVYGAANYSAAITLLARDLYELAKLAGVDVAAVSRLILTEFQPVNLARHYEDPDTGDINITEIATGWKSRTSSTPTAVDANAEVSLDGGCDLAGRYEGECYVAQFTATDGMTNTTAFTPGVTLTGLSVGSVLCVENPAGVISSKGMSYDSASKKFYFTNFASGENADAGILRIVYKALTPTT